MGKRHEVIKFFKENALQLSVQIIGVLVLGLNTWFALKLVPLTERIIKVENEVLAIDKEHTFITANMVTRDDMLLIITRIDKISSRLDGLISILIKP